jgi:hypothetical protein
MQVMSINIDSPVPVKKDSFIFHFVQTASFQRHNK